jgi:hypothetical protein
MKGKRDVRYWNWQDKVWNSHKYYAGIVYQAMYNAIIDSPTSIEEIIHALYRGTKVNPRPYNVSCTENVYVEIKDGDVIFGVELPNLEVGTVSNGEGPICHTAREVLRFMGIGTSREFAAAAAFITLAREFNFALLHLRGEMYADK